MMTPHKTFSILPIWEFKLPGLQEAKLPFSPAQFQAKAPDIIAVQETEIALKLPGYQRLQHAGVHARDDDDDDYAKRPSLCSGRRLQPTKFPALYFLPALP